MDLDDEVRSTRGSTKAASVINVDTATHFVYKEARVMMAWVFQKLGRFQTLNHKP